MEPPCEKNDLFVDGKAQLFFDCSSVDAFVGVTSDIKPIVYDADVAGLFVVFRDDQIPDLVCKTYDFRCMVADDIFQMDGV